MTAERLTKRLKGSLARRVDSDRPKSKLARKQVADLDEHQRLRSDLWLDQPDAHEAIDGRHLARGDADALHRFVDEGYFTFNIDLDDKFCDAFNGDITRLWSSRPADLSISLPIGEPTSFADYVGPERERGYRLPDLHGHSARALSLYLHPEISRIVDLVFDQPSIAFQSLYFEYGSEQALHRDAMFVRAEPASHLLATWIALEDITADAGPLSYIPRTHDLPWIEFTPGNIVRPKNPDPEAQNRWLASRNELERTQEGRRLTCPRGTVFVWHAGLMHGGSPVETPGRTRKSLVIHYSTAANYHSRTASQRALIDGNWIKRGATTDVVLRRGKARGLDAPLRAQF
jgi:ectoine hydroxylase-related dioxygenase (phytanoyl-CoA dioxygenase family)